MKEIQQRLGQSLIQFFFKGPQFESTQENPKSQILFGYKIFKRLLSICDLAPESVSNGGQN